MIGHIEAEITATVGLVIQLRRVISSPHREMFPCHQSTSSNCSGCTADSECRQAIASLFQVRSATDAALSDWSASLTGSTAPPSNVVGSVSARLSTIRLTLPLCDHLPASTSSTSSGTVSSSWSSPGTIYSTMLVYAIVLDDVGLALPVSFNDPAQRPASNKSSLIHEHLTAGTDHVRCLQSVTDLRRAANNQLLIGLIWNGLTNNCSVSAANVDADAEQLEMPTAAWMHMSFVSNRRLGDELLLDGCHNGLQAAEIWKDYIDAEHPRRVLDEFKDALLETLQSAVSANEMKPLSVDGYTAVNSWFLAFRPFSIIMDRISESLIDLQSTIVEKERNDCVRRIAAHSVIILVQVRLHSSR